MTHGNQWEWIVTAADNSAAFNMDFDANRLEMLSDPSTLPSVRAYTWARPAVTFGRLQDAEQVHALHPGIDAARRPTGGRAVLHGNDLTLAIVARNTDIGEAADSWPRRAYRQIVDSVSEALVTCGTRVATGKVIRSASSEVDCFASALECDLVDSESGLKLVGCAQRRTRQGFLIQLSIQHRQNDWNLLDAIRNNLKRELRVTDWVSR